MENCELTRYYTVMEEEMADNWDEMRKKIHQEIFKMELENDELPYTGPDTTTGEENAKLKRDIGSSPVSLATSEPVSPVSVLASVGSSQRALTHQP